MRKEEGAELLRSLGAEHVVVTSREGFLDFHHCMSLCREGWQHQLKELIAKLNISVAFDAIAGDMSGTIMEVNYIIIININLN